ncbi:MAG: UDP-N-acetylmuramoyl-tripeptide--D-alanyl-D-alanine ligase [Gemmatimonadota bacterium]
MSPFTWSDRTVREALGLRTDVTLEEDRVYGGVSTDSRRAAEADLYVALIGERFDGHDFVADALAAGAGGAVVSHPVVGAERVALYPVEDTLEALGRLARHRRDALPARVVGITGSTGKTGTKDMTAAALATTLRVHATLQNLNNRVGVPLTLLSAPEDADAVVVEMGTNEPGEIEALTRVARPDVAVITTVGESHLEGLGSVEGVLREKLDLVRGIDPERSVVIVGDTPPSLARTARQIHPRVRAAGLSDEADEDLRAEGVEPGTGGRYTFRWRGGTVELSVPGRHAVANAVLALAVADALGVPAEEAAAGLATVEPGTMRGELRRVGDLTLVLDCYNANPQSVRAAMDLLEDHPHVGRRVVVLGTMLELGASSDELHREVLLDVLARNVDVAALVGGFARAEASLRRAGDLPQDAPEIVAAETPEAAYRKLSGHLRGGELVLLKASRGVALEALLPLFEEEHG